jgi:hypothetical protein
MDSQLLRSEELGVRLEIVKGLPIWESSPVEIEFACSCSCTV